MTVLVGNSPATAAYFASNLVVPVDYKPEVSQRLVDAALTGDLKTAYQCIIDPFVDVNFVGAVSLRSKRTEIVLCDEQAHEVRAEYEQFRTEVTALFLAAHSGNLTLVRKLLVIIYLAVNMKIEITMLIDLCLELVRRWNWILVGYCQITIR